MNEAKKAIFNDMTVVLLMGKKIPVDNIYAINQTGEIIWRIGDIIKLPKPEAYVALSKISSREIRVISSSGILYVIDVFAKKIVSKQIVK